MEDYLFSRRKVRVLTIEDRLSREGLALDPDFSLTSRCVIRTLDEIAALRGYPLRLRVDNGPENVADAMLQWSLDHNVHLHSIDPGQPAQNAWIESFNARVRDEFLNANAFWTLWEMRDAAAPWLVDYSQRSAALVAWLSCADGVRGIAAERPHTRDLGGIAQTTADSVDECYKHKALANKRAHPPCPPRYCYEIKKLQGAASNFTQAAIKTGLKNGLRPVAAPKTNKPAYPLTTPLGKRSMNVPAGSKTTKLFGPLPTI